jgi:hypothetical protein
MEYPHALAHRKLHVGSGSWIEAQAFEKNIVASNLNPTLDKD